MLLPKYRIRFLSIQVNYLQQRTQLNKEYTSKYFAVSFYHLMMWSILQIYIGLTLFAICVRGFDLDINKFMKRNELIDGIFRPINAITIGDGRFSSIFKGVNMIDNRDVALKFSKEISKSKHEYEMYSYLNAIDNPEVEKYGISPIHYYNESSNVTLTVFSLFECDLSQKKLESNVEFHTIDYLILFRDFVRQSKYIHSRGIRHDDVQPKNIMLRKNRSFLIDFTNGSKMNEFRRSGSLLFGSRRFHQQQYSDEPLRRYLDDWESFLYTMAFATDVQLQWFDLLKYRNYDTYLLCQRIGPRKEWTAETIKRIEKDVECEHLKNVMVQFAKEAFKEDGSLPRYNHFEKLITKKIDDMIGKEQPAVFSWLAGHARDEAIEDIENNPPATAAEIDEPKTTYRATDYKTPKYDYFKEHRDTMTKKAYGNHLRYLEEKLIREFKLATENEKKGKLLALINAIKQKINALMRKVKKFAAKYILRR